MTDLSPPSSDASLRVNDASAHTKLRIYPGELCEAIHREIEDVPPEEVQTTLEQILLGERLRPRHLKRTAKPDVECHTPKAQRLHATPESPTKHTSSMSSMPRIGSCGSLEEAAKTWSRAMDGTEGCLRTASV